MTRPSVVEVIEDVLVSAVEGIERAAHVVLDVLLFGFLLVGPSVLTITYGVRLGLPGLVRWTVALGLFFVMGSALHSSSQRRATLGPFE